MTVNKAFAYIKKDDSLDSERSIICYASTNSVDRHGDMILPTAWSEKGMKNYRKNPVILLNHDYHNTLPVGKSLWQKVDDKGLKFKIQFADTPLGNELYYLYSGGYMSSFSVGFRPVKTYDNEDTKKYKDEEGNIPHTVYEECELLELSAVNLPANADANMIRTVKGLVEQEKGGFVKSKELIDFVDGIKKSKEYIELVSESENKEVQEKAKVIGHIDLGSNKGFVGETDEGIDLDLIIDGVGIIKSMKKIDELELKQLAEIAYGDVKDFYNDDGGLKYLYYENVPENLKSMIKEYKTTAKGYMDEIVFHDKLEALEELSKALEKAQPTMEDKPKKPCNKEDGECTGEDCEEYGTCEDEAKKSFEIEGAKNEDAIEDKGISDDSEAGLLDIPDNVAGEAEEIIEEKEVNPDEIESKNIKKDLSDSITEILNEEQEELNKISTEEVEKIKSLFDSCRIKENIETYKKEMESDFDITQVRTEPHGFEYKIFCKYLGCKIKNISSIPFFIPHAMMGNYLSAFKNSLEKHELIDQRSFTMHGFEVPLRFSSVKLNSKKEGTFLTDGTQFYKTNDGNRFIFQISPDWGGLFLTMYSKDAESELLGSIVKDSIKWVKDNNLLKGEKFSIMGEFLDVKELNWDSVVFPDEESKMKIKSSVDRLSKDSASRGIMLIGPPGTGKTMTGKILMNNPDTTFIWASSKDFRYGANGALSLGFELARDLSPSIFFLEDIDTWINGYTVDLLKTEMDGMRENKGVLTILTSNFPEDMPEALIDRPGRFHHIINFSLPNKENRIKLLKFFVENADKEVLDKFAELTEGFSGAHLKELVDFAKTIAEDENISIEDALIKSFDQMKKQREMIQNIRNVKKSIEPETKQKELIDVKIENKSGIDFEINDIKTEEKTVIDFEIKKQSVDFEITREEAQEIIKNSIINVAKEMQSVEDLVDERIKRAKGIIF